MNKTRIHLAIPIIICLGMLFYFVWEPYLYRPVGYGNNGYNDPALPKTIYCHLKKVLLSKKTYNIPHDISDLSEIQLRIDDDGIESGFSQLAGIMSDENNKFPPFSHCEYVNTILPANQSSNITHEAVDNDINTGITISFGTIENGTYKSFASAIISVQIFSKMNNKNHYSLDEVMQDIVDRYNVSTQKGGTIKISFKSQLYRFSSSKPDSYYYDKKFAYSFAKLNEKEVFSPGVEFISKDNGKTWDALILKYEE